MKAPRARKRKCVFNNYPARRFDLLLHRGQITGIKNKQKPVRRSRPLGCETSGETAIVKAGVIGSLILELPTEDGRVKLLRGLDSVGRKLNVVDLIFRFQHLI